MVAVSVPILLGASLGFGPLPRAVVVAGGFVAWLLSAYPTATLAGFPSLTAAFAIRLGLIFHDEPLTMARVVAFLLVAAGIILLNRRAGRGWVRFRVCIGLARQAGRFQREKCFLHRACEGGPQVAVVGRPCHP